MRWLGLVAVLCVAQGVAHAKKFTVMSEEEGWSKVDGQLSQLRGYGLPGNFTWVLEPSASGQPAGATLMSAPELLAVYDRQGEPVTYQTLCPSGVTELTSVLTALQQGQTPPQGTYWNYLPVPFESVSFRQSGVGFGMGLSTSQMLSAVVQVQAQGGAEFGTQSLVLGFTENFVYQTDTMRSCVEESLKAQGFYGEYTAVTGAVTGALLTFDIRAKNGDASTIVKTPFGSGQVRFNAKSLGLSYRRWGAGVEPDAVESLGKSIIRRLETGEPTGAVQHLIGATQTRAVIGLRSGTLTVLDPNALTAEGLEAGDAAP